MNNLHVFVMENNQVNEENPPPRVCPRCNSNNTRFCYYNNYCVAQPRYTCKNCRRLWTHGGTLRNIPIGGSGRKTKRPRTDEPSVAQVVAVETQHVNHHQPILHDQETNDFPGSIGGSSSSVVVVQNQFGSLAETHSDMGSTVQSLLPMDRSDFNDGSFPQGYYHVGSSDVVGNPLTNQSIGGHVNNYNSYRVNQEDPDKSRQNHNASTSGNRG